MGRIYDGDVKLNVLQVCDKLRNEINAEQANVLASRYNEESAPNAKGRFAAYGSGAVGGSAAYFTGELLPPVYQCICEKPERICAGAAHARGRAAAPLYAAAYL